MKLKLIAVLIAAAGLSPLPSAAQEAPAAKPVCAAMDVALPSELAAWTSKVPLTSAAKAADLPKAALKPGQAVTATLHPTREVAYLTQPEKPGGSVASGGLFDLTVAEAGTYRIILSSGAWLDVLDRGKALDSVAHKPGPPCSTARKTVDFALAKGAYVLQVSANADRALGLLLIKVP